MEFLSSAAILPVTDIDAAVARYGQLGFATQVYENRLDDGRAIYAFLRRDQIALHLSLAERLNPHHNSSAVYLYVDDPDALFAEWSVVAPADRLAAPADKEWGVREMTYVDPDGNLLRIGRILKK